MLWIASLLDSLYHRKHWLQTYHASCEEAANGELTPTVIVGVADNKARKDKEEINRSVSVVKCGDESIAHTIHRARKGKTLEDVIYNYQ